MEYTEITLWGYSYIHLSLIYGDFLQARFYKYGFGTLSLSYSNKETVFAICDHYPCDGDFTDL